MAVKPLLDFDFLTKQSVLYDLEEIRKRNPQRYDMEQLSAIVHVDKENELVAGYKELREDEFWVQGHIPGRPLFPGVLMLEAGAQLSSFLFHELVSDVPFFGFAGLDDVRFRGEVKPGNRLYLLSKALRIKPRQGYFYAQGIVEGKPVFEAKILGMAMR